jgi:hypothetical protein
MRANRPQREDGVEDEPLVSGTTDARARPRTRPIPGVSADRQAVLRVSSTSR